MPSSASKKPAKPPTDQRQTRSIKDTAPGPAPAILVSSPKKQRANTAAAKMAQAKAAGETAQAPDLNPVMDTEAITRPILKGISASKAELMGRIDHLSSECNLIRHDLDKIRGRLTTVETRVSDIEDTSHDHGAQLAELRDQVRALQHKAIDAEDRQRRNNIRVVGLPEGAEGDKPAQFAELFFKELLSIQDMPTTYVVERAHRVPTGSRPPGAFPRLFLVRFLNFRDMLLTQARKLQELRHENTRVMLFPDFSAATQQKQRSFNEVRRRLREKEVKYSMLYPSKLRVQHKGMVKFFEHPEETCDWMDKEL